MTVETEQPCYSRLLPLRSHHNAAELEQGKALKSSQWRPVAQAAGKQTPIFFPHSHWELFIGQRSLDQLLFQHSGSPEQERKSEE